MGDKEKGISGDNHRFMKKVLKSSLYTVFVILFWMFVVGFLFGVLFNGKDSSIIIILCMGIIFTIFYCTMTILEEIRNFK